MIVQIGEKQIDLRQVPWVTLALSVLCLGFSLALPPASGEAESGRAAPLEPEGGRAAALEPALAYWSKHAYLGAEPELLVELGRGLSRAERRARIDGLRNDSYRVWPSEQSVRDAQQAELDALTERALAALPETAADPRALVPDAPRLPGLLVHPFLQADGRLLVASLLVIALLGCALEAAWRSARFAVFSLASALFTAVFYYAMVPGSTVALAGPSALTAAWLGAALVTLHESGWRLPYPAWRNGAPSARSVTLPAWSLALLWLANEALRFGLGGLDALSHQALVGGLVFGAGAALVLGPSRMPREAAKQRRLREDGSPLERAREAQARGDAPRAFAILQGVVRETPREREVVLAFWDVALACSRTDAACPPMLALIGEFIAKGEDALAARYWLQVTRLMPKVRLDAATLVQLAPILLKVKQKDAARDAVRKALGARNRGLTGPIAVRAAELAAELGLPDVAAEAGRFGLAQTDLDGPQRVALRQLISDAEADAESRSEAGEAAASDDEDDEPAPGDEVSSAVEPRFQGVKVLEGVPEFMGDSALSVSLSRKRALDVEYSRIQAVAAAGVLGLGDQPVVIIDLALNWNDADGGSLHVVRLRGDRFDPRAIVGDGVRIAEAYRVFLRELLTATRAVPLPDEKSACGGPMRVFESIESYERKVLGAAA